MERDPFVVRVVAEGDGHAGRERSKQNLVGGGASIRAAGQLRLVRQPAELTGCDSGAGARMELSVDDRHVSSSPSEHVLCVVARPDAVVRARALMGNS